jgi:hypothetical protein
MDIWMWLPIAARPQKALISFTVLVLTGMTAIAQDQEPTYSAESLVMMLSSEEACKLSYDKEAIERYVKHNSDRHLTIPNLGWLVTSARDYTVNKMSPSTLVAHCTQVRETAKHYDFIK